MGLHFRHSIDIIFTCYVYENRKWFRSRNSIKKIIKKYWSYGGEGETDKYLSKVLLGLVSVYKNTHTGLKCLNANFVMPHNCCKHFPKSICREFISNSGLFFSLLIVKYIYIFMYITMCLYITVTIYYVSGSLYTSSY